MRLVLLLALLLPGAASAQATFTGLGDLPGGAVASRAYDVSGDATTVVGSSESANGTEAFRWSGGVMQGLGDLPTGAFGSAAYAVSGDGSVVVGSATSDPFGVDAFRWTAAGGMQGLSPPPSGFEIRIARVALGVSADGERVVGLASDLLGSGCFMGSAFEWTPVAGTELICVPLTDLTESWDVSADGTAAVGTIFPVEFSPLLVQREYATVTATTPLGTGEVPGRALAVSADGSVIVGEDASFLGAFRWSEDPLQPGAGTLEALGHLPGGTGASTFPWDVSADGSLVVGTGDTGAGCDNSLDPVGFGSAGCRAFVWDAVHGMRPLADVLETVYGLDLGGWTLTEAHGVSDDGRTLVGWGIHPLGHEEAWIATLPPPPACDDGADNDGDGLADLLDPGCDGAGDASEQTSFWPCDDGVDNDGDGGVDFRVGPGGDVGCRSPDWIEAPQCQDGLNNDPGLDALIDFDGGASAGVPPAQQTAPDPECSAAWDTKERPSSCGLGFEPALLLAALAVRRRRRR